MPKRNGRFIVLRDIQDHAISGDLSLFELGVYALIHFQTDFASGVWLGSAVRVHATAPRGSSLRDVQRAMEHLEELEFLRSFRVHGQRGNAPYLVNKYEPLTGAFRGKRLNAFASEDWQCPVYESCALPDTLRDTEAARILKFNTQYSKSSKKNPAAKPAPLADPRFQPFLDFAYQDFQAKHGGQRPNWSGRHFKSLKALLGNNQSLTLPELQRRWHNYSRSTDAFTAKQGDSLSWFCEHFDAFISGPIPEKGKLHGDDAFAATLDNSGLDATGKLKQPVIQ